MATIPFYNEDNNIKVSVRNEYKNQMQDKVQEVLGDALGMPVQRSARKTIMVEIGTAENGTPIYAEIEVRVTDKDPKIAKKSKKKSKTVVTEPIKPLFEDTDAEVANTSSVE